MWQVTFQENVFKGYEGVLLIKPICRSIILSFVLVVSMVAINHLLSEISAIANQLHGTNSESEFSFYLMNFY